MMMLMLMLIMMMMMLTAHSRIMLIHIDETFLQSAAPENIMTNNQVKKRILIDIKDTLWQKYFRQGFGKII